MKSKMRNVSVMIFIVTLVCMQSYSNANLITNGDFESGNTDFITEYPYIPQSNSSIWNRYSIDTNPQNIHPYMLSYNDHTSGSGQMMIVDGGTTPGQIVWQQTVAVEASTNYELSYWLATCSGGNTHLARIEVLVNDISLGIAQAPDNLLGIWEKHTFNWNSGSFTNATIKFIDIETEIGENDFTLDDITLIPEPATLSLLALGGLVLRRRNKK